MEGKSNITWLFYGICLVYANMVTEIFFAARVVVVLPYALPTIVQVSLVHKGSITILQCCVKILKAKLHVYCNATIVQLYARALCESIWPYALILAT